MKAWMTATFSGICAYDGEHVWKAGDRIFRMQGADWVRPKFYCGDCARALHHGGEDTGEPVEVIEAPVFAPLRALAEMAGNRFDSRMAAAGKDE